MMFPDFVGAITVRVYQRLCQWGRLIICEWIRAYGGWIEDTMFY